MAYTPRYVFKKEQIIENYNQIKALLHNCDIYYSLKANSDSGVIGVLNEINSGFEVSSLEEFKKLLNFNVSTDKLYCGLPIKKAEMIEFLYNNGCDYFVFDDIREFDKLRNIAPDSKKILRIYICDLVPNCIEYGMSLEKIEAYDNSEYNLLKAVDGISFHISENKNTGYLSRVLERVEPLLKKLDNSKKLVLNIGGSYTLNAPEEFYRTLNEWLEKIKKAYDIKIIAEPGSAIINKAGKIHTKVIMIKERGVFNDVYLDAGIPTGLMRQPGYIKLISREGEKIKRKPHRFFDITSLHRPLFQVFLTYELRENDILELGDCGAYTLCYSNVFHSWESPRVDIE